VANRGTRPNAAYVRLRTIEIASARALASTGGYRAMFDLRPEDDSPAPVELRLYLRVDGQPLTETWMYQWSPPPRPA